MSGNTNVRAAMVPVSRQVRAYFAPVQRATAAAAIFDPAKHGAFPLDAPPAPWLDLGWIDNLRRASTSQTEQMRSGARGETAMQFRGAPGARGGLRSVTGASHTVVRREPGRASGAGAGPIIG